MKHRGDIIFSWREPTEWRKAALSAPHGTKTSFPTRSWLLVPAALGVILFVSWAGAAPEARVTLPIALLLWAGLCVFVFALCWCNVQWSTSRTATTLYERGIAHGRTLRGAWIPWERLTWFNTDEGTVGGQTFRLLCWQCDHGEEECSVVPASVDLDKVAAYLESRGVPREAADHIGAPC